jgi:cyclophilin family peptidyl-prolyl cis-trans isomerase
MALCASDYYQGCLIHRNIRDFMAQTGDPTGTGKGGESIWGGHFEDEFCPNLKVSLNLQSIAREESSQWQTKDLIPMDHSFT